MVRLKFLISLLFLGMAPLVPSTPTSNLVTTTVMAVAEAKRNNINNNILPSKTGNRHNRKNPPLMIAHRGDKFLMPEHSIPAYDLAMLENVDFVEPDLVMTSDMVFVCHHDLTLKALTDVAEREEFKSKMVKNVTLYLDGKYVTIENDWFISDFTFAELRTLKVKQQEKGVRPQFFNNLYGIPSFQEYIDEVHKYTFTRRNGTTGVGVRADFVMGMIPELKNPDYHNEVVFKKKHVMEDTFLEVVKSNGYLDNKCEYNGTEISCSPFVVQCFNVGTIKYLSDNTNLELLTLLDTNNLRYLTFDGLKELKGKTKYVSLWKELLFTGTEAELAMRGTKWDKEEMDALGGFIGPKEFVDYAHGLGFEVGIYTIYQSGEPSQRGCAIKCVNDTKEQELEYYFDMGVDAFFIEGICESLRIRDRYYSRLEASTGSGTSLKTRANKWKLLAGTMILILLNVWDRI